MICWTATGSFERWCLELSSIFSQKIVKNQWCSKKYSTTRHSSPEKNFHFLKNFCSYQNSRLLLPLFGAKNTCSLLLLVWAVWMHKIEEWITKNFFEGKNWILANFCTWYLCATFLWGQYLKTRPLLLAVMNFATLNLFIASFKDWIPCIWTILGSKLLPTW